MLESVIICCVVSDRRFVRLHMHHYKQLFPILKEPNSEFFEYLNLLTPRPKCNQIYLKMFKLMPKKLLIRDFSCTNEYFLIFIFCIVNH